jgi:2-methylaconitate isomerase
VKGGSAVVEGAMAIPGVAGAGAPVRLDFLDPGGASTGRLLPTGHPCDVLDVAGLGKVEVSMVDAANACVFLDAASLGLRGTEMPQALEADAALLAKLAAIRERASVAMGIATSAAAARARTMIPLVAFVSPAQEAATLSGERVAADAADLTVRMLSNGQPHRALPVTGSLCAAVAASIPGSIPHRLRRAPEAGSIRLAMPSGILTVGAEVVAVAGTGWSARRGTFYRTARRLFEGFVHP